MGIYDTRPLRPNSIELRSYQSEQIDGTGYEALTPGQSALNQYAAAYGTNGISASSQQLHLQQQQHHHQQQQQLYDSTMYHQSHGIYGQSGQGAMSPEPIYGPGTPSRNKPRPSQPPPAPPSNGSGGGTPTASNANTPTRGRSMSTSRDALPPPPPVPDVVSPLSGINGAASGHIAAKLLGRANSTSRAGSPQLAPSNSAQNANDMVMAQLNTTFNNMTMANNNQLNSLSDLPPPPPVPDQVGWRSLFVHQSLSNLICLFLSTHQKCRRLMWLLRRHHHLHLWRMAWSMPCKYRSIHTKFCLRRWSTAKCSTYSQMVVVTLSPQRRFSHHSMTHATIWWKPFEMVSGGHQIILYFLHF